MKNILIILFSAFMMSGCMVRVVKPEVIHIERYPVGMVKVHRTAATHHHHTHTHRGGVHHFRKVTKTRCAKWGHRRCLRWHRVTFYR